MTLPFLAGAVAAVVAAAPVSADNDFDRWVPAGNMGSPRIVASAATLRDGRVLVAGGALSEDGAPQASAELWDPRSGQFSPAAPMQFARAGAAAVTLRDGRVLVAGGASNDEDDAVAVAEVFDPASGAWSNAGTLLEPHVQPVAVALADGRVLVVGSEDDASGAEVWNPATGQWRETGPLGEPRALPAIARLRDGRVLVAGGSAGMGVASAEIYDPATDAWTPTAPLGEARIGPLAAVLPDGRVLVAGGFTYTFTGTDFQTGSSRTTEIFDPARGTWTRTGDLNTAHGLVAQIVTLADGRPAIVGGLNFSSPAPIATAELFDAARGTWTQTPPMAVGRAGHVAAALTDGSLLVAGGLGAGTAAERIGVPKSDTTPPIDTPRSTDPKAGKLVFVKLHKRLKPSRTARVAITLRCSGGPCRDRLVLKRKRTVLAKRDVTLAAGRTLTVHLKLRAATRRTLRRHSLPVTIELQRQRLKVSANLKGLTL